MIDLVHGDNIEAMERLSADGRTFALCYADPPFMSGRAWSMPDGELAFDDRWRNLTAYLQRLEETVVTARALLTEDGCLVLHVDSKVSHYAKVMLDGVFGRACFASEIVWRYRRWPTKTTNFQRVHDTLLRYRKSADVLPRWNQLYEPLAASTRAQWGAGKQRAVVVDGRRIRSSTSVEPSKGVPMGDVWYLGIVAPSSSERTGFPTQKPEALLSRLVEALTCPGDSVLDPYCGSGTTLAVCGRLGRSAVGIDSSPVAIRVARERLERPARATAEAHP